MNGEIGFPGGRRLGRGASFSLLVFANVLLMASTSAPSPIYPLYLERWGFSVTILTVVFAVYVAGLVGALLTVGSLSDHLGRRPVLVASLLVAAAGTAIFWAAGGVYSLVLARVVQGIATGMATGALAAGLVEFSPEGRPHVGPTMTAVGTSFGLAIGGGLAGLLVQVSPRPDAEIFPVLTLAFVVLAALVFAIPETVVRRTGGLAALRPRVRVPRETRREFFAALPAIVAGWSTTGLFLALAPSLVRDVLHVRFGAAGGISITVLFIANCAGGLWAAWLPARGATLRGAVLLSLGAAVLAALCSLRLPVRLYRWIDRLRAGCRPDVQRDSPWHQRGHDLGVAIGSLFRCLRGQLRGAGPSLSRSRAGGPFVGTGDHELPVHLVHRGAVLERHAPRRPESRLRPDQSRPSRLQSPGEAADRYDDRLGARPRTPLSVRKTHERTRHASHHRTRP